MTEAAGNERPAIGAGEAASLSYAIDRERRLVTVTYVGRVNVEHVVAGQKAARTDPDFDPGFALLFDYTRADPTDVDVEAVKRIAANTPFATSARRAFLVADELAYGMVRMFRGYSELAGRGDLVEVFRDRDEALRWLAERPSAVGPRLPSAEPAG